MEKELAQRKLVSSSDFCRLVAKGTGEPESLEVFDGCQPRHLLQAWKDLYDQSSKMRDTEARKLAKMK